MGKDSDCECREGFVGFNKWVKTLTVSAERALLAVVSRQTKTLTVSAERALLALVSGQRQ